jgi:hypothetical protein
MATATCEIEVMYKGQQWIGDQIQKVNIKINKDLAAFRSTTAGCDAIRSADTPGGSSPEWGNPTAEGVGLFLIFLPYVSLISTMLCCCLFCVHMFYPHSIYG